MGDQSPASDYVVPPAATHLQATGRSAWQELCADMEIEDLDDLRVLTLACEALDRSAQARRRIRDQGLTYTDKAGTMHAHPAVAIEARSATRAATLIKQLQSSMVAFERLQLAQKRAAASEQRNGRITRHGGGQRRVGG